MGLMAAITLFHSLIMLSFVDIAGPLTGSAFRYFLFQILLLGIALYGGGMYITCILIEHFSAPQSRQWQYFKKTIRFLHGPLSHAIFEVCYFLAFWNVALMQQALGLSGSLDQSPLLFVTGLLAGSAFIFATIGNGTYLIYIFAVLCSLPFFLTFMYWNSSVGVFNWGFVTATVAIGVLFLLVRLLLGKPIRAYQPINFFMR